jgi:hypothetical protein
MLITDAEFVERRANLQKEALRLEEKLAQPHGYKNLIEPFEAVISFSNYAADLFETADARTKRLILKIAGSNLTLAGKKLSVQAAKPFLPLLEMATCPSLLASVDDVRTFSLVEEVGQALDEEPKREEFVDALRELGELIDARFKEAA